MQLMARWGRLIKKTRRAKAPARMTHPAELPLPPLDPKLGAPLGSDWAWCPELWSSPTAARRWDDPGQRCPLSPDVTLYHDSAQGQIRATTGAAGLQLQVKDFTSSFLSLAIDLPRQAAIGLELRHLVRLRLHLTQSHRADVFARLNIKHGPNVEQIVREIASDAVDVGVDFDLAYASINEKRLEKLWLDLIFESPQDSIITVSDLTLSRHPRAAL